MARTTQSLEPKKIAQEGRSIDQVGVSKHIDFGGHDAKLVIEIRQLQADASYSESQVDRSHAKLYEIFARCLALSDKYTKEHPAFKASLKDANGNVKFEYTSSTVGRPPSPFKPVVWQIFRNPPPQTLYRYASVLSLVDYAAKNQGVDLTDTKATVRFMKKFGRLDAMVDFWKEVKASNISAAGGEIGDAKVAIKHDRQAAEAKSIENALTLQKERPPVATIPAGRIPLLEDCSLTLFTGQWSDDGGLELRHLDPVLYASDSLVLKAWQSELEQRRSTLLPDPNTVFVRDICVLAKAIRERKRPTRGDKSIYTHFHRRITFRVDGFSLIADGGLVDTSEGVTLEAALKQNAWNLLQQAAVYRSANENHEEVIEKGTRGDLKRLGRIAMIEFGTKGETEKAISVIAKLRLQPNKDNPVVAYLVNPSSLKGAQMRLESSDWDYQTVLSLEEVKSATAVVETFNKFVGVDNRGKSKRFGFAFVLGCKRTGLTAANYDGLEKQKLSKAKGQLSGKAITLKFRTDDWIACTKAMAKFKDVEEIEVRVSRDGLAQLAIVTSIGVYRLYIPSCDDEGTRTTKSVASTKKH